MTPAVFGQDFHGTLRGNVLDMQGRTVPNAGVTLTNENTNALLNTETSAAGVYIFPGLPVGSYTLRVEASGFAPYARTGIQVFAAQVSGLTVNLILATTTTQVIVEAGTDTITTETSQLSGTFAGRSLSEIPIATGANLSVLNLAVFLPHTTTALGGTSGTGGAIGGLRGRQNSFSIDGVDNNDPTTTVKD